MESHPEPVAVPRRGLGIIWIVPLLALVVGAYVIHRELSEKGPLITIDFEDGAGVAVDQTKLVYKGIVSGVVTGIHLWTDLSGVQVEVQLLPSAAALARADSRFWINRPEISLQGVRGLDTLLSGVTIAVEPGGGTPATRFTGLEHPPVESKRKGTEYLLVSPQRQGINVGTPLAYRGLEVGRVVGLELAQDSRSVRFRVMVEAPFNRLVRENSVFWNASGIDMDFGLFKGLRLRDGGVESLLQGAISFATPDSPAEPAAALTAFPLANRPNDDWLKWSPEINLTDDPSTAQ